jgi:hypothetical protein
MPNIKGCISVGIILTAFAASEQSLDILYALLIAFSAKLGCPFFRHFNQFNYLQAQLCTLYSVSDCSVESWPISC